ncbi:unnamed protein product [Urochloa humidicola]
MEKTVADLADLVKKMREDRISERESDREAITSLKKALEDNTAVMKDVVGWRSEVDSKMDNLQLSVKKLSTKVDQIALHQEEAENPAYKVFQTEHLDLTKPAAAHLAASLYRRLQGNVATTMLINTGDLAKGWLPPLCRPRSKVRNHTLNSHLCLLP